MSKKMKSLVVVLVAVFLLTVGTTVALAQEGSDQPPQPQPVSNPLWAKVAQLLGISEQELTDAFAQAHQQLRQEKIDQYLAEAVEKGIITQDEAKQITEWWAKRPAAVDKLKGFGFGLGKGNQMRRVPGAARNWRGMGPGMGMGRAGMGGWWWQQNQPTQTQ